MVRKSKELEEFEKSFTTPITREQLDSRITPLMVNLNVAHSILQLMMNYLKIDIEEFRKFCEGKVDKRTGLLLSETAYVEEFKCSEPECKVTSSSSGIHMACGKCSTHCTCEVNNVPSVHGTTVSS